VYFHVQWEQPGPLPGKTQSNSTVALWRYNFGVVSITGRNRWDRRGSCDGSSMRQCPEAFQFRLEEASAVAQKPFTRPGFNCGTLFNTPGTKSPSFGRQNSVDTITFALNHWQALPRVQSPQWLWLLRHG